MKARIIGVSLGLIAFVVLSVLVVQRLSAEAMAVFVGVVAGVAASIPTSLIVVWFALRTANARAETVSRPAPEARPPEPRIVLVTPSVAPAPPAYGLSGPPALPVYAQPATRLFTVIGGSSTGTGEASENQEMIWQP